MSRRLKIESRCMVSEENVNAETELQWGMKVVSKAQS